MVAITVILAAVIGTFVLGLGDQVQQTAPNAQFSWAEEDVDAGELGDSDRAAILTHESGDAVNTDRLTIRVDGTAADTDHDAIEGFEGSLSAGSQIEIGNAAVDDEGDNLFEGDEETIRIVWQSQDGDRTATLTSFTVSDEMTDATE